MNACVSSLLAISRSRSLCLASACLALLCPLHTASAQETLMAAKEYAGGRLEQHRLPGSPSRTVAVWLPPGYDASAQRYPVAYLLHGYGGSYARFTNDANAPGSVARLADGGRIEPMILVMPNRMSTNWVDSEFWDFIATDLVTFMDRNFRTEPQRTRRAVSGHSMGGMDALIIALLRPDVFQWAGAMDGARCTPCQLDHPQLAELLKLHKQYLFPLSLWIQWGTASFLPSPRPVLDFLDALAFPYEYLESTDDHDGSLNNTTDEFLLFFSDHMRAVAATGIPPQPGRVTEHFVVVAGSVLDIGVDLPGLASDPGADLRVDLSALGLAPLLLNHDGSGRYTGALRVPDTVRNGLYILPVTRVGGLDPEYVYGIRVSVLPSEDLVLFGDALSPAWQLEPNSRLTATPDRFDNQAVLALKGSGSWILDWPAKDRPPRFGYEALTFAFHTGTASVAESRTPRLRLGTRPGTIIDLLTQVDLASTEWQPIAIPLEAFGADERLDLASLSFSGNLEGTFYLSNVRLVRRTPPVSTAVLEEQSVSRPQLFALQQNYPNPFNSGTTIRFDLSSAAEVELAVFNLAGQKVATLAQGHREASTHTLCWDGLDDAGHPLASGVYLYQLRAADWLETRRLLVLR